MYRDTGDAGRGAAASVSIHSCRPLSDPVNTLISSESIVGIDLFAGAGGFSLAAISVGIDIVCAIENCRHAASTYSANLKRPDGSNVHLFDRDILSIDPSEVMEKCALDKGRCDVILGGPPCQGFSTHRLNGAGVADPRNALLSRYFEFVAAMRPRAFLIENVPGLLWERHRVYLDGFVQAADEHEYDLTGPIVLNARDYGVPQNRKRVFILGVDRRRPLSLAWPPEATHCSPAMSPEQRAGRIPWNTARSAFDPAPKNDPNNVHMLSGEALVDTFKKTPVNGGSRRDSGRILPCHLHHDGHKDVYGRIDPSKPSPTMTTACINPSKGRFVHPTEHHGITLRQAARLQGFPDHFEFQGGLTAGGQQVGNAVPIELGKALLRPLYDALAGLSSADQQITGTG
jgi:DNA (cytosine-5)-methyltransferase 1